MVSFRSRGGRFNNYSRGFGRPARSNGMSVIKRMRTVASIERLVKESQVPSIAAQVVEAPVGDTSFTQYPLPSSMQAAIVRCGFTSTTPIQAQVIPAILGGQDVIGLANTGTGKTASFLIPLLTRLQRKEVRQVIILAPTRELALQIQQDMSNLSTGSNLNSVLCIGGTSVYTQKRNLQRRYDVLIGTPGRVKDMYSQGLIRLSGFDAIVLDEVDRMLDMGFIKDVRSLLVALPSQRQSLFFSATLSPEIEQLCQTFSKQPVTLSVRTAESVQTITQQLVKIETGKPKFSVLYDLLSRQTEYRKVLIFGRTKHGVKRLAQDLHERGFAADSIHGNKTQAARQKALEQFRHNRIAILVATDVAARGIDVADITHVINYDLPESTEDYIHRIGRTGRAGNSGTALTFIE